MTFLYTASTFLVMVVLVIGITLINNYEKMEGLEMALSDISRALENQEAAAGAGMENGADGSELSDAAVEASSAAAETEAGDTSESSAGDSEDAADGADGADADASADDTAA